MKRIFKRRSCCTKYEFESYFKGNLNEAQIHSVEAHLLDCSLCQEAMEGYHLSKTKEEDLQTINNIRGRIENQNATQEIKLTASHSKIAWTKIAAIFLTLLIPASIFLYWNTTQSISLFEKYYEPFEVDEFSLRGQGQEAEMLALYEGVELYGNGDFEAANVRFKELLESGKSNPVIHFYLGISQFEQQAYNSAIPYLERAEEEAVMYREESLWYLALAYLKMDNIKKSKLVLAKLLQSENSIYQSQAENLLEELE